MVGRYPDFLCIGAQRSGTTWLHANLSGHPDLWLPPYKEIHYFDQIYCRDGVDHSAGRLQHLTDGLRTRAQALAEGDPDALCWLEWAATFAAPRQRDDTWYARLFASVPARMRIGEITPAYATLPDSGVAHIRRLMPDVRIVFMIRDPVERLVAGAIHHLTAGGQHPEMPSPSALLAELDTNRCRSRSGYRHTIETWEHHFPGRQMLVMFFEDVRNRPRDVLRNVCDALGMTYDEGFFPVATEVINRNPVADLIDRRPLIDRATEILGDELSWLADRFGGPAVEWWERAARRHAPPKKTHSQ